MTPPAAPSRTDDTDEDAYDRLRRRVLWAMPTGLYLIGSRAEEPDGTVRRNLMTANLVVQVATEPKLVAVAVDAGAVTRQLVEAGGCFSVTILDREDRAVVRRFVKPVTEVAVDAVGRATSMGGEAVVEAVTGAPILARAAGWLDCRIHHQLDLGSHQLFVGQVVAAGGPEGDLPEVLRMEDTRMNYGG
jgi:flavin reductase (DIM6/NTAB) family NADH-FMN oxidoreductase RutF